MSSGPSLCEYCAKIPLDPDILDDMPTPDLTFSLGAGSRVENSPCPLCRLVVHTYYEGLRDSPSIHKDVSITWYSRTGPGNRGAFAGSGDTWICFEAPKGREPPQEPARDFFYLRPKTDPTINIDQISHWISRCEQSHSGRCHLRNPTDVSGAFPNLEVLRLVDLERHCIVEIHGVPKYVALSYVWGAVANFRLTRANKAQLSTPGCLTRVEGMVPTTIKDAMALVRRLGARYMWVDSLCLMQNDPEDMDRGINVMDLIYERAWLTVVASSGQDANAGLPGVRRGTRKMSKNTIQIKPGVSLGVVTGLDRLLKLSVYNSRAWTFQELVIPRRVLYFTDSKVYFRCRKEEFVESCLDCSSVSFSAAPGSSVTSLLPEAILMTYPLFDYSVMLMYYTKRALTNQNDALRAMAGIIRRFTEVMKCRFFQGLPTALFDIFVMFKGTLLHRRPSFPSYSWTGWRGAVDYDISVLIYDTNAWLRDRTWIIWYKRSPSGFTNLVWDPMANESFPTKDSSYDGYRQRRPFSFRRAIPGNLGERRTNPTQEKTFPGQIPNYPMLQFWTLACSFTMEDIDNFAGSGDLVDRNQNRCGRVSLDGFEESTFFQSTGPFEFIILSETDSDEETPKAKPMGPLPGEDAASWKYFNVMLLEWSGGIAQRRGLGFIHQWSIETSVAPGPIWKEIFLA